MSTPHRILFISNDAENELWVRVESALPQLNFELLTTPLKDRGLEIAVAELMPELIIVDLSTSLHAGLLTCLMLRALSSVPTLALVAETKGTVRLLDTHGENHLSAPFNASRLENVIDAALFQDSTHI